MYHAAYRARQGKTCPPAIPRASPSYPPLVHRVWTRRLASCDADLRGSRGVRDILAVVRGPDRSLDGRCSGPGRASAMRMRVRRLLLAGALLVVATTNAAAQAPTAPPSAQTPPRSEEHTSELQSLAYLVCRLLLEKKKNQDYRMPDTFIHSSAVTLLP